VEHKEGRGDQAEGSRAVVPAQMVAEVERCEYAKDHQRDDLLDDLELDGREAGGADSVGRDLQQVLKESYTPADQNDLPQRLLAELQVAVPSKRHEDVGEDEKNNGPHNSIRRQQIGPGCRDNSWQSNGAMTELAEKLARLEEAIAAACRKAGRSRSEVELMAVSKTYPAATIAEATSLGLRLFGENRVQEFAAKAPELAPLRQAASEGLVSGHDFSRAESPIESTRALAPEECSSENPLVPTTFSRAGSNTIRVHLIGHLQTNKAARAAEIFDGVDSVDSVRLAEKLNEAAAKLAKRLPVLIEVKLSPEETKAGLEPESPEASQLLGRLPDLEHLETKGLMTIAPWGVAEEVTRVCFRSLREWRERWAAAHPRLALDVLSMGMSGDFELAIEEGATRIRIGTALFGKREPWTGPQ